MLDEIMNRIRERSNPAPTRQDIAELLASVGKPGTKQTEKRAEVEKLFDRLASSPQNSQGHSVLDSLDSFGEY